MSAYHRIMERAKKMVLISTENLERMQQMQHHRQPEISSIVSADNSTKKNTEISDAENFNNSVRTPGTPLSRLDAEMWRILNLATPVDEDERWKLYKEVLQRYLHFVREAKRRLRNDSRNDTRGNDDAGSILDDGDQNVDVDMTLDDDLTDTRTSISGDGGNSDNSFGKKRAQSAEMIKEILNNVPKTYRVKAHALIKYLLDIPPSKISWDRRGLVTIDGVIVTGSNISDLINDAIRERKTVKAIGRIPFARLLRDVGTPSNLIGNRDLKTTSARSQRIKAAFPRGSSTPKTPLAHSKSYGRKLDESEGDTQFESITDDDDNDDVDKTLTSNADSLTKRKRGLLDWSKLD